MTHELGHYFGYLLFGAVNVRLHSVSVSAEKETLSNPILAFINIIGRVIFYLTIIAAFLLTRKTYRPFWIMLELAAPIGRLVNPIYIYFRTLGHNPNPNFDEYNFSRNLGIEPLFPAILTTVVILVVFIYFFRRAWCEGKFGEIGLIIAGLIVGLAFWSFFGSLFLP